MAINPQTHLILIAGGKGGVGKSVFATNLAFAFQLELRTPVLLIDADSKSCGDLNVLCGMRPVKTLAEISNFGGSITPQTMNQVVAVHPAGVHYIGAVNGPEERFLVDTDLVLKQIENLSRFFKFIIVDVGNDIGPLQTALAFEASAMMVVTTPEILVVNQTQRFITELLAATIPLDLVQLVVNKFSPAGVAPQLIAKALRVNPLALVPNDEVTAMASVQKSTPFVLSSAKSPVASAYHEIVRKLTAGPLQKNKTISRPRPTPPPSGNVIDAASGGEKMDADSVLRLRIHDRLQAISTQEKWDTDTKNDPVKIKALEDKTRKAITVIVDQEAAGIDRQLRSRLIQEVFDEALGLGPLEDLLKDPNVSEIMVNGANRIFVERNGRLTLSGIKFTNNDKLRNVVDRIVQPLGRRIDEKTPYVDARLKDGSRVNAVIEPLSLDGPAVTIRKFKKGGISPEKYVEWNSLTPQMLEFLKICVQYRKNVVISGGTGSGKTSLLNMLSTFIPEGERVITVEDAAELQLQQEHVVRLETRPASIEGTGAVSIRDLIKNALRMRPDRIVVGETRDGAALDMLQAMNTGHDGSMTTTHANSPRECLARLETLCLMAGMDLPLKAIRDQISKAVHIIVQIQRLSDGTRKVTHIHEVGNIQGEQITLAEVFEFKETDIQNGKVIGSFKAMGFTPKVIKDLERRGVAIPKGIFESKSEEAAKPQANPSVPPGVTNLQQKPEAPGSKPQGGPVVTPVVKKVSGGNS